MIQFTLRMLSVSDCTDRYLSWLLDPDNRLKLGNLDGINTLDDLMHSVSERHSDPSCRLLGIFCGSTHVGNLQARLSSDDTCILSILIGDKRYRGRGLGRAAMESFLSNRSLLPSCVGKVSYYACINSLNPSSLRLFESLGFAKVPMSLWPQSIDRCDSSVLYALHPK